MQIFNKKSAKAQKGFTLVELSVVILIAGLMLTAVIKGQSMLETARAAKFVNDLKNIETLIGNFETAKGRLPGDCNADGLIGTFLNSPAGTLPTGLAYTQTAADQATRAQLYSNVSDAPLVGSATAGGPTKYCITNAAAADSSETDPNTWINDLRAYDFIGSNTVPRLFAKHIGEDATFVGTWFDLASGELYNAIVLVNVPASMAQRVMQNINGNDTNTSFGQLRVITGEGAGTYVSNAFAGNTKGSVVNLVYFYRNQPRKAVVLD